MPAASGARSSDCRRLTICWARKLRRPEFSRRRPPPGQQLDDEAGELAAALFVGEPVGDERGEVDAAKFGFDRGSVEEMPLDEFAELFRDPLLVGGNDRRVRDRQAERSAKQGDDGVPVCEAADRGSFSECCEEAEGRVPRLHDFCEHQHDEAGDDNTQLNQ